MITRFDHVVIGVPDIPDAVAAYKKLGFDVAEGGQHPSIGTRNAIIRFGLDYIELLAVEDKDQAYASGSFGGEFADAVKNTSGLVAFVLASDNLDEEAAGLAAINQSAQGPFAMDRVRPDGRTLSWRLVIPGSSPWRKPWPFLIEWETPDSERLSWDFPGTHDNGACGVKGIDLLVDDLSVARKIYEDAFGMKPAEISESAIRYQLGDFSLSLNLPTHNEMRSELTAIGPGPFCLALRHKNSGQLPNELPLDQALGARIKIT